MVTSYVPLLAGIVVGLSIAVPVGPMGLLCIQRSLRFGMGAGFCTGLGAATVNAAYGILVLVGLDRAGTLVASGGRWLGAAGGVFLLWSAARTAWAGRRQHRAVTAVAGEARLSATGAYGSAVLFNATNPLSPALMLAMLSPVVALHPPSAAEATVLMAGLLGAVVAWWACLSGTVSLLRSRLGGGALLVVNRVAAAMLTVYGAMALARSAGL